MFRVLALCVLSAAPAAAVQTLNNPAGTGAAEGTPGIQDGERVGDPIESARARGTFAEPRTNVRLPKGATFAGQRPAARAAWLPWALGGLAAAIALAVLFRRRA